MREPAAVRRRPTSVRALLLLVATVTAAVLAGPAAVASCAEDSGPTGSAVVFVGRMEEERRGFARFTVEEVRAGPDLAPEVWVLAGQEQAPWPLSLLAGVSSSGDADFEVGEQYVVGASGSFSTGVCSIAEGDGRPDPDARAPVAGATTGADPPVGPVVQGLAVAGLALAVAAVVLALRRRRRGPRREVPAP